jgi:hypothetical protein
VDSLTAASHSRIDASWTKQFGDKLVVARRDPPTLLDPIEEPLDLVAGAVEIRAEQIESPRFLFGGMLSYAPLFIANSLIQSAS